MKRSHSLFSGSLANPKSVIEKKVYIYEDHDNQGWLDEGKMKEIWRKYEAIIRLLIYRSLNDPNDKVYSGDLAKLD